MRTLAVLVLVGVAACDGRLVPGEQARLASSWSVASRALDLYGSPGRPARTTITIEHAGAGTTRLRLDVEPPFHVQPRELDLQGDVSVSVSLVFRVEAPGIHVGELALTDGVRTERIALAGTASPPESCSSASACLTAEIDTESGDCRFTQAADGTACGPPSDCSRSVCFEGACVGAPVADGAACASRMGSGRCRLGRCERDGACDDGQGCTRDSIDATGTCRHDLACSDHGACLVPYCNEYGACGYEPAVDGIACGEPTCEGRPVCRSGRCVKEPVADGTRCTSPCGDGRCAAQKCVDEDPLAPAWRYVGAGEGGVVRSFLDPDGNLHFVERFGADASYESLWWLVSIDANGKERSRVQVARGWSPQVLDGDRLVGFEGTRVAARRLDGMLLWERDLAKEWGPAALPSSDWAYVSHVLQAPDGSLRAFAWDGSSGETRLFSLSAHGEVRWRIVLGPYGVLASAIDEQGTTILQLANRAWPARDLPLVAIGADGRERWRAVSTGESRAVATFDALAFSAGSAVVREASTGARAFTLPFSPWAWREAAEPVIAPEGLWIQGVGCIAAGCPPDAAQARGVFELSPGGELRAFHEAHDATSMVLTNRGTVLLLDRHADDPDANDWDDTTHTTCLRELAADGTQRLNRQLLIPHGAPPVGAANVRNGRLWIQTAENWMGSNAEGYTIGRYVFELGDGLETARRGWVAPAGSDRRSGTPASQ